jgi:hypothetical protein
MRFAVLTHDHPHLHWDLLLQVTGEKCRTWRLSAPPALETAQSAEAIGDHRVFYLDYEGPVSGDRGTVTQWDAGELVWLTACDDLVRVCFRGTKLCGVVTLERTTMGWVFRL